MSDDPNKQDEKHRPPPKNDKSADPIADDLGGPGAANVAQRRDPKHDPLTDVPIDTPIDSPRPKK